MLGPQPPKGPLPDPMDKLTGTCRNCGAVVTIARYLARHAVEPAPNSPLADPFADLPSGECPVCQCRVYLSQVPKLVTKG